MKEFFSSTSTLEIFYIIIGLMLLYYAYLTWKDEKHQQKIGTIIFWIILAILFIFGKWLPPVISGILVVIIAIDAGIGKIGKGTYFNTSKEFKEKRRKELGNKLLIPILIISGVAILFAVVGWNPLIGLGFGSVIALILNRLFIPKETFDHILDSGRSTSDAIGWALVLPPYLGALGALFNQAGVGEIIARGIEIIFPVQNLFWALFAYAFGMALFTIIMGNAFAAFAVITAGIGIPIVIQIHGADPATIAVLAMSAGYCGTLMTPMAANFNIVPAALLEMKDKYRVIKIQISMALALWVTHLLVMYIMAF
ncbi:membrane protein [Petrotoga miotherma DSM 10691]|jgi:uncharacterized membrane protein|uniref:Membrane protein n=2 Tax=Petrotoga TaxID=28236 RepID=A0A2K1PAL4_9BACT|nr:MULTISPECIES: DUF979 domain-containing protein [Petrotoga]PNR99829.1 membrane protein [Petrotoga miotherma DSM 10691]POZ93588.1 hypothetical protein AA81_00825 [Petrotoga halophila DSM 16923]